MSVEKGPDPDIYSNPQTEEDKLSGDYPEKMKEEINKEAETKLSKKREEKRKEAEELSKAAKKIREKVTGEAAEQQKKRRERLGLDENYQFVDEDEKDV